MRSGQILVQQLLGEDFALHHLLPNGDCFYEAVAYALSSDQDNDVDGDSQHQLRRSYVRL